VGQGFIERDVIILPAEGPGESGTGGGERWEAELCEEPGTADVSGIGNDEAATLVQVSKGLEVARVWGHGKKVEGLRS
jgi:hypothetical protein